MKRIILAATVVVGAALLGLAQAPTVMAQPAAEESITRSVSGTLTVPCVTANNPGLFVVARVDGIEVGSTAASPTDGTYTLAGLAPGTYSISPFAPGGCGSVPRERTIDVTAADAQQVDFDVVSVADVSGTVRGCPDADTIPAANVTVNLFDGSTKIATTTTQGNGYYFFQWQPARAGYSVEVVPGEGCTVVNSITAVDLSSGDVQGVDFDLTRENGQGGAGSLGSSGSGWLSQLLAGFGSS